MIVAMVNGIPNSSITNRSIMMIANIHVGIVGAFRTVGVVENEVITDS